MLYMIIFNSKKEKEYRTNWKFNLKRDTERKTLDELRDSVRAKKKL